MKCYDKELVINGKVVRSPEQQVYKNMEDIEELQKKIQTWYASSVELTTSSNTILRSNTNVPDDKESGLLIDPVGNMFNITGGDETTLLIEFYASIKGPQGPTGASSNDKGTYITHVEPTLSDSVYTLSTGNIDNFSTDNIPVQVNDIIVYIDSDDQPTSVYTVASISGTTLTLSKQGDYAKGKQLYQHNITARTNTGNRYFNIHIINDSPNAMNYSDVLTWLNSNGIIHTPTAQDPWLNKTYPITGAYFNSGNEWNVMLFCAYYSSTQLTVFMINMQTKTYAQQQVSIEGYDLWDDRVVSL